MSAFNKFEGASTTLPSETMIFKNVFQQTGVERTETVEIHPTTSLSESAPVDFNLESIGQKYIDTRRIKVKFSFKIVAANGDDLQEAEQVTCVNLIAATAFSQVDVYYNQKLVSSTGQNYPYKAILDTLLHYGIDAKTSQLQNWMYFHDTSYAMESTDPVSPSIPIQIGLINRYNYTKGSKETQVIAPLFCDALTLNQWLLNSVAIRIRLWPSKNVFRLMGTVDNGYRLIITKISLLVDKVHMESSLILAHSDLLKSQLATYPYVRTELRTYTVAEGLHNATFIDCFQREVPDKLCVCLIGSSAYDGQINRNPFNFHHYNVNFIGLSIGNTYLPTAPLTPIIAGDGTGQICECYQSLFTFDPKLAEDRGLDISRFDFEGGYFLVNFNLSSSLKKDNSLPLQQLADLKLEVHFGEALPEPVVILVYGTFPAVIQIDEARNVIKS